MPIYVFEDAETGLEVDVHLPVAKLRDEIVLKRRKVPESLAAPRITPTEHQKSEVLKGYRQLEDAGQLSKSSFTPAQIKRAWEMPDNEG